MCSLKNRSVRVVLHYDGGFVVSPYTGIRRYEAKKIKVKNHVDFAKLSIKDIKDMFSDVLSIEDALFYLCNGITPDKGYKLLFRDDQVPELYSLANSLIGGGVVRLHQYRISLHWGELYCGEDNEANDRENMNMGEHWVQNDMGAENVEKGDNVAIEKENVDFGEHWASNDMGAEYDLCELQEDNEEDEDYQYEGETSADDENEEETELGNGGDSDSDWSDCRRIRDEVRKEQEQLSKEMSQEIRDTLQKYKGKGIASDSDCDSDSMYSVSLDSDEETDEEIAYL